MDLVSVSSKVEQGLLALIVRDFQNATAVVLATVLRGCIKQLGAALVLVLMMRRLIIAIANHRDRSRLDSLDTPL